jgi:hypothetical protein
VLRALPARRYEIATFQKCRVNIDYHFEVDHTNASADGASLGPLKIDPLVVGVGAGRGF